LINGKVWIRFCCWRRRRREWLVLIRWGKLIIWVELIV